MVFAKTTKYKENDMSHHKHLTLLEREMIFLFYNLGLSISLIATLMMRNKSTISRELKRNSENGRYIPYVAESFAIAANHVIPRTMLKIEVKSESATILQIVLKKQTIELE